MNTERSRWIALYVLCTGMLMIVLDVTVVNVALPYIQSDLGFSDASLAWVVNAYLIAFGGLLLLAGRLGDLVGRQRIFLIGLAVFTVASAVCGLAPNGLLLVLARFVQGAGGALTSSVILGMIVTMFHQPREQAKAIGVFAFVASAGGAVGLLAGGVLTQAINWHWIFFINVPIGIATAACARRWVPADPGTGLHAGLDLAGAGLVTVGLMLGVYTIVKPAAEHGWTSGPALAYTAASLVLLAGFLAREATAANPLVPLTIFRSRNLSAANVIQVLGAAGMYGTFFLGALYVQRVLHYSPLRIGFAFLPVSVLMGLISVRYADRLIVRFGGRKLCVAGLGLISLGLALLGLVPVTGGYWLHLFPSLTALGIGAGLAFPPLMGLAMSGAAPQDAGLASGLVNTTGQVGGALGLAVFATLSSGRTGRLLDSGHSLPAALTGGYRLGFWIAGALVLAGAVIALLAVTNPGQSDLGPASLAELDLRDDPEALADATC
ncbi:MAG TPA: DHA2 family efflux MFS transporter permease subunit [Jatrophihabitans sp.]|nr:DHA2 family efflux MFS transporter permease subunit [Jatrophihabitans sp.]